MSADVDPLSCDDGAAHDWCARHRVPWALVFALRRGFSAPRSRWVAARRAFVVEGADGREVGAHDVDDAFWRTDDEAAAWRRPAVATDPARPVRCECGLTVTFGADLALHRAGVVHLERMAAQGAHAA